MAKKFFFEDEIKSAVFSFSGLIRLGFALSRFFCHLPCGVGKTAHIYFKVPGRSQFQRELVALHLLLAVVYGQGADVVRIVFARVYEDFFRLIAHVAIYAEEGQEECPGIEALQQLEALPHHTECLNAIERECLQAITIVAHRLFLYLILAHPLHGKEVPTTLKGFQRVWCEDAVVGFDVVELLIGDAQEMLCTHGIADGAQKDAAARDEDGLNTRAEVVIFSQKMLLKDFGDRFFRIARRIISVGESVAVVIAWELIVVDDYFQGVAKRVKVFEQSAAVVNRRLAVILQYFVDVIACDSIGITQQRFKNEY